MDTYVYKIGNNLYVNLTNRCSNRCTFCVRDEKHPFEGYDLWLKECEPTAQQVIDLIGDPAQYGEIVFCGFGEPTYRLGAMLEICDYAHAKGGKTRLNTNGHGSIINQHDITADLVGRLDGINISLNASNARLYEKLCRPIYPEMAFDSMLFFAQACREKGLNCWFSVVDCIGEEEVAACQKLADSVGIPLRVREMIS